VKWYGWKTIGQPTGPSRPSFGIQFTPFELSTGTVLFCGYDGSYDQVYSASPDYTTWTRISDLDIAASIILTLFVDMGSSVLYCLRQRTVGDARVYKSSDNGANWTETDNTNLSGYQGFALNKIGADVFLIAQNAATTRIDVFKYDSVGDAWNSQANFITTGANGYIIHAMTDSSLLYFVHEDAAVACLFKYDNTGPSITKISTLTGYRITSTLSSSLFLNDAGDIFYITVEKTATSADALLKSDDTGATWTEIQSPVTFLYTPPDYRRSGDHAWIWDLDNKLVKYYDQNLEIWVQISILDTIVGGLYLYQMCANGLIIGSDSELYQYQDLSEKIKDVTVYKTGTEKLCTAHIRISPLDAGYFRTGDIVELYTDTNTLVIRGRVVEPANTAARSLDTVQLEDVASRDFNKKIDYETPSTPNDSAAKIQSIIDDNMKWCYRSSSIDPDGDISQTYVYTVRKPGSKFANLVRELEKALFYFEPDGKTHLHATDNPVSSGLTWSQATANITLLKYLPLDQSITRSEVKGGYNSKGQVRRVYIGNAAKEVTQGPVLISRDDPNLNNDTEALQLATNRYTIYSQVTRVVKLYTQGKGYIQPGESITFSWNDGRTVISSGTFYVMEWEYNLKTDDNVIWLIDNIVTEDEISKIKRAFGEDAEVNSTYYDSSVESSSAGNVLKRNPAGVVLGNGSIVWLGYGGNTAEPSAAHFNSGGGGPVDLDAVVTVIDTWYDLDLSAIIPKEARAACIKVEATDNLGGSYIKFRRNGQSNAQQTVDYYQQITNRANPDEKIVAVDDDQVCEILMNPLPPAWTTLELTVLWWSP